LGKNDQSLLPAVIQNAAIMLQNEWTESKVQVLKDTICRGTTDQELSMFVAVCQARNLNPFAKQIYCVMRWDRKLKREVMSIQVGVDGYRLIAVNSGEYNGQSEPYFCGEDGVWKDIWLDEKNPPLAAKVEVYRKGIDRPFVGIAKYKEFVQKNSEGEIVSMWKQYPCNQLAKCAEAQGLRKGFPELYGNIEHKDESATSKVTVEELDTIGEMYGDFSNDQAKQEPKPKAKKSKAKQEEPKPQEPVVEGEFREETLPFDTATESQATSEPAKVEEFFCSHPGCGVLIEVTRIKKADNQEVRYTPRQLVDKARELGRNPLCWDHLKKANSEAKQSKPAGSK
jgi:phage recombination protein Bet